MSAEDGTPLALMANQMPATPSGRIELASDTLAARWGAGQRLPGYQPAETEGLALISPASDQRISSTLLGHGGQPSEAPALLMHPRDAKARGLGSARRVRVRNALGEVELPLTITARRSPGS